MQAIQLAYAFRCSPCIGETVRMSAVRGETLDHGQSQTYRAQMLAMDMKLPKPAIYAAAKVIGLHSFLCNESHLDAYFGAWTCWPVRLVWSNGWMWRWSALAQPEFRLWSAWSILFVSVAIYIHLYIIIISYIMYVYIYTQCMYCTCSMLRSGTQEWICLELPLVNKGSHDL